MRHRAAHRQIAGAQAGLAPAVVAVIDSIRTVCTLRKPGLKAWNWMSAIFMSAPDAGADGTPHGASRRSGSAREFLLGDYELNLARVLHDA